MRRKRLLVQGSMYHITARSNRKEKYLASSVAKDLFIETLEKLCETHDCTILNFMVMNNHIHLVLQPHGTTTLSEAMKWLLGVYTMNYNRVFKTWGTVWGGRYFSRPINGLSDLIHTMQYIDLNPVRAFLVEKEEDWVWGGLYYHRSRPSSRLHRIPEWVGFQLPNHSRLLLPLTD